MHSPLHPLRRLALAALAGVLGGAALTGCDTDLVPAATGPTVQFATPEATITEGTALRIPVVLTNGDAAAGPVSVDVLFAAGASTACAEVACPRPDGTVDSTDFTGLPAPTGAHRIVRLTFAPAAVDTQYVEIEALDDGNVEPAEIAAFALQNAQNATIGANREFAATIGVLPIAVIRQREDGDPATVEGIVTRAMGRTTMIQDETAGITIFAPAGTDFFNAVNGGSIEEGDRIQVVGEVDIFSGLFEISFVSDFAVIEEDAGLPAPQTVTLAQLAANIDAFESELLRIPNITINPAGDVVFSASRNYTITDAAGTTFILRVPPASDTDAVNTPIPTGPVTFTGVLGEFNGVGQLTLVHASDLTP